MFYRIGNVIKMHDDPYLQLLDDLYRHIIESRNSAVDDELPEVSDAESSVQVVTECIFEKPLSRDLKSWSCDAFFRSKQVMEAPSMCAQCKFAHELNVKLYSCDDDIESLVYCDKHEVMCKAQRHACDWAAL